MAFAASISGGWVQAYAEPEYVEPESAGVLGYSTAEYIPTDAMGRARTTLRRGVVRLVRGE